MSAQPAALPSRPQLPTVLTPLLGRESELDHLQGLVDTPSTRLITLTGPAGVGKSRLALHLATTLMKEFNRDVVFVPLASIRDPGLFLPTIGQALGLPADASETIVERVATALEERQALLVLDNFEQLLDAAPGVVALLAHSSGTTVLITSQAALGIAGEHLYPLLPLPTPAADQTTVEAILQSDAVALFVARARAVKPALVIDEQTAGPIAEICRRLDGLPLAIELAAARINILSPNALLARLGNRLQVLGGDRRGVPDRLRTMRHAITWSYDLLAPEQQVLFRYLSVFAGGFTLDAVEGLSLKTGASQGAIETLGTLVDHSLVQVFTQSSGENRFLMLETLREYGLEQLILLGEEPDARLAHASWFLQLATTAEPHLVESDQEAWLNRLDPEWDNVRAAANWSLSNGRQDLALRLLGAIWRFCSIRGHVTETRVLLDRALAVSTGERTAWRTRALVAAGNLAQGQRDLDMARSLFERARDLAIELDEVKDEIQALIGLAKVAVNYSDYPTATDYHQRAASLAREADDQRAVGTALGGLAYVAYFQGRLDDAVGYWEEARQVVKALGDNLLESVAVSNLGAVAMVRGEIARAQDLLNRALELQRRMQAFDSLPYTLTNLAETWRQLGDYALAEDLLAEAVSRFRELGYTGSEGTCLTSYAQLALDQRDHERAAMMLLESTRLIHDAGDQLPITENADVLADICIDRGNQLAAIELLAASTAIRSRIHADAKPLHLAHVEGLQQRLRQAVSPADYERHWQVGTDSDLNTLVRRITIVAREIVGPQHPRPAFIPETESEREHLLTNRELEVLGLLVQGKSTRDISDLLFISPRTTTTHINNILGKIDVTSRAAAVAWAMRTGLR